MAVIFRTGPTLVPTLCLIHLVLAFGVVGCGRGSGGPAAQPSTAKSPAVISLVPAATDILIGMGADEHLVGVSNFDENPAIAKLPRVGDYLTTDWEKIARLRPQLLVTQYSLGRTPEGFLQNARALGITQLNLHIDRLDDVFTAMGQLGEAVGEPQKGARAERDLKAEISKVRQRVAGKRPVRTLIVTDDAGRQAAGPGEFLDDVLSIAGGTNALGASAPMYPTIDREQQIALAPEVILQLLPNASPQVREQARRAWDAAGQIPAVRDGRVYQLTEWNVELPGYQLGHFASKVADLLHPPEPSEISQTRPSP